MTLHEPERDQADDLPDIDYITEYRSRATLENAATFGEQTNKINESKRCVTRSSGEYSVAELGDLESADVDDLCEHLGSVDMSGGCKQLTEQELTSFTKDSANQPENDVFDDKHTFFDELANETPDSHTEVSTVDTYTRDKDGDTNLHTEIILLNLDAAMLCIGKAPTYTWISFKNKLFQTPLHLAVLTNQPVIVRRLITAGANLLSRDMAGNTPLHIACRDGMVDIVRHLLEPVRFHETEKNKYDIPYQRIPQDFSVSNYDGLTCLHLATMNKHRHIVDVLIDSYVDVNLREGKTGRTILHNSCLSGDILLVRTLLKLKRCNINARAYDGLTPFDLARARSHEGICMVLAAAGARYGDDEPESD